MTQKAYLVTLSGMGDTNWKILNQTDHDYLIAVEYWNGKEATRPMPTQETRQNAQDYLIKEKDDERTVEDVLCMTESRSSSLGNDLAILIPPSLFNGETFDVYEQSIKKVNAFATKHDLEIEDGYDGMIY